MNNLFGTIPTSLYNYGSIFSLILRDNSLIGSIDLNYSSMINHMFLDLADNKFYALFLIIFPLAQN